MLAYIPLQSYTRNLGRGPIMVFATPDGAIAASYFRVWYMATVRLLTPPEYPDSGINTTHLRALASPRGYAIIQLQDLCLVQVAPVE